MRIILSYNINFDKEALKHTEEDYENIDCTANQSKLIEEISIFLCLIIKIPESAIRGIVWNALRDWQLKNNKTIAKIAEMPIGKRLNAVKEIFYIGRKILKRMLKDPKAKSEIIIDIAFERAFKFYLNYLNKNSNQAFNG